MVKKLTYKLKPKRGFAHLFHLLIVAALPIVVFVLVRIELESVALAFILLSKWRMFAVRPRHWFAHVRTNAVDIIFSLSMLAFMTDTNVMSLQLLWVVVYEIWILFIKPGSSPLKVTAQALLAQLAGMVALFIAFEAVPLVVYILGTVAILYFTARHFLGSFDEKNFQSYSWMWALFGACLVWLLGHWLLFYGPIAQPALMLSIIGYGMAALYYLAETDKLSKLIQRQVIFVMVALIVVIVILSDWGNRPV